MDATTRRFFEHMAPVSADSTIPAAQLWLDLHRKEAAALPIAGGVLGGAIGARMHYNKTKPRTRDGLSDLQVETRLAQRAHEETAIHQGKNPKAGLKAKYHAIRVQHADAAAERPIAAAIAFGVPMGVGAGVATDRVAKLVKPYTDAGTPMFRGTRIGNMLGIK